MASAQETADRLAAGFAVVERPVVHVHADELVRQVDAHVAGVLQRVLHRLGAVLEAVPDAALEHAGDHFSLRRRDAFVNDIAAERQRQPFVLAAPPHAKILAANEPLVFKRQLTLVDDQPHVGEPFVDGFENLVERHDGVVDPLTRTLEPKLQREERARHRARHSNAERSNFLSREFLARHQHRPVAVAHARAARQQRVLVTHVRVGVDADRRDVEFAPAGPLVQGLDVLQDMLEVVAAVIDQPLGQTVKHERVVRIGRVPQREFSFFHGRNGRRGGAICHATLARERPLNNPSLSMIVQVEIPP